MKRFFERIREKALDPAQPPVLIAAFGDSVTQGAMELGRLAPDIVFHRHFQRALEGMFPTATFSTINAGVGGTDLRGALGRLERDVIRHQPDLVLAAFGLNDSVADGEGLSAFEQSLRELVSKSGPVATRISRSCPRPSSQAAAPPASTPTTWPWPMKSSDARTTGPSPRMRSPSARSAGKPPLCSWTSTRNGAA